MSRFARKFAEAKAQNRAALVTFTMAGDPSPEASTEFLLQLPEAGADIIEIGMPFSDPMADGPTVEEAGIRARKAGQTLPKTLEIVGKLRASHPETPIVLMGYYNPLFAYGTEKFVNDAAHAGVDGLIIVDLPPEEEDELQPLAKEAGIDLIRLVAPTTPDARMPLLMKEARGFLYHVAVAGITGQKSADLSVLEKNITRIRKASDLPLAVGFGIRTPEQAAAIARLADGVVVGSAIVDTLHKEGADKALELVRSLAAATRR